MKYYETANYFIITTPLFKNSGCSTEEAKAVFSPLDRAIKGYFDNAAIMRGTGAPVKITAVKTPSAGYGWYTLSGQKIGGNNQNRGYPYNQCMQSKLKTIMITNEGLFVVGKKEGFNRALFSGCQNSEGTPGEQSSDGSTSTTPFMHTKISCSYYANHQLQAIELPYHGNKMSMVIISSRSTRKAPQPLRRSLWEQPALSVIMPP